MVLVSSIAVLKPPQKIIPPIPPITSSVRAGRELILSHIRFSQPFLSVILFDLGELLGLRVLAVFECLVALDQKNNKRVSSGNNLILVMMENIIYVYFFRLNN